MRQQFLNPDVMHCLDENIKKVGLWDKYALKLL